MESYPDERTPSMSAANGGRGKPPVPPEGHGPQAPQVPPRRIVEHSLQTEAQGTEDGKGLVVTFLVSEAGEPVLRSYIVGEPGRKAIQEVVNGGIETATLADIPKAA
jgi:hypothetical protein